jgi:hypothetical protein
VRALILPCLTVGLLAADAPRPEAPEPGRDRAFLGRILGDAGDGTKPWRTFRPPAESASATVEVVGELTPAELRQVAFQEFLVWFQADLRRYLHSLGGPAPGTNLAAATLPVMRYGGNPVPQNVPLGRVGF